MLATLDHGDTVPGAEPSYLIHIYGAVIAGRRCSVPLMRGDFFNELSAIRESYPKPEAMMILVFHSSLAQCRTGIF